METEYKTIEVGTQTFIMNEETAMRLFHEFRSEFGWVGTFFCPSDIRHTIIDRREADDKKPYTDEQLDKAVAKVMDSSGWYKFMEDWMQQEGFEVLNNTIWDEVEYPEEQANN